MRRSLAAVAATVVGAGAVLVTTQGGGGPAVGGNADAVDGPTRVLTSEPTWINYGMLQLEVTLSGDSIAQIKTLQAPTGESGQYSDYALPILIQEAIEKNTAEVQMVSGATYTSEGFIKVLTALLGKQ